MFNVSVSCFYVENVFDIFFFFFQAEDGIRDWSVTGVQTCALPICGGGEAAEEKTEFDVVLEDFGGNKIAVLKAVRAQIGRASCRERV